MPKKYKLKTHKGAQKRLHVTGTGKILRTKGRRSHLQRRKAPRAKRLFGQMLPTSPGDARRMKHLIPYGV